jgi:hypothetical protein
MTIPITNGPGGSSPDPRLVFEVYRAIVMELLEGKTPRDSILGDGGWAADPRPAIG